MASIMILAIAILPMVSMFDMGLNAATQGSNYDKARALAKKQLESAQSLPYGTVKTTFPSFPTAGTAEQFDGSGLSVYSNRTDSDSEFSNFKYELKKQFVAPDDTSNPMDFSNSNTDKGLMQITVVVGWGGAGFNESQYTATILKAK